MVRREPRRIVGFDVVFDKSPERLQQIAGNSPSANLYCADGYLRYVDIVYPGKHIRNIQCVHSLVYKKFTNITKYHICDRKRLPSNFDLGTNTGK